MNRRDFITGSAAIIAASRLSRYETLASQIAANKRVGLIGSGWYGKSDLLRLVQVAPVNVVSLCDVDSRMLSDAADLVATRQASKQKPRTFSKASRSSSMIRRRRRSTRCCRNPAGASGGKNSPMPLPPPIARASRIDQ